jgi:hypothetical protein
VLVGIKVMVVGKHMLYVVEPFHGGGGIRV